MMVEPKPKRKVRIGLILLCSLALLCYFLRYDLVVLGFDFFLKRQVSKHFSHPITYESVHWRDGKLVVLGLNLADEHFHLGIDRLEMDFEIDWSHYYFETHLQFTHPELTLVHTQEHISVPFNLEPFIPGKHFGVKFGIQHGVLQLNAHDGEQRLYFSFKSGKEKEQIGSFYLSHDPDLFAMPTSVMSFELQNSEITASLKVGQMESIRLLQLLSFFYPVLQEGWDNIQGEVELIVSGSFTPDLSFSRLAGLVDAKDVYLSNALLGVQTQARTLHAEFIFPPHEEESRSALPFWKQIRASATIDEGEWILGEEGIKNISAHLLLDPSLDPLLDLSGIWIRNSREVPLSIQSKGCVHEDQSFWLEMDVNMTPFGAEASEALISICSSEKQSYVMQAELKHLDAALLEGFFDEGCAQGSIKGKFTGWVEDNCLTKLQLDDFHAQDIVCRFQGKAMTYRADALYGDAQFSKLKNLWHIDSLKGEIPKLILSDKDFKSPPLRVQLSGGGTTLIAVLFSGDESLETHFDLYKSEGWLRAENLSESAYAPWLHEFYPEMHMEGTYALFGSYNKDKMFISLQGKEIVFDHPLMTFHSEEMLHAALLNYSFREAKWQGAWTFQDASVIIKESGLHFNQLAASLELEGMMLEAKDVVAICPEIAFSGTVNVDFEHAQLNAELQNVETDPKNAISIHDGRCELSFDSKAQELQLSAIDAALMINGQNYRLEGYAKRGKWWDFDMQVTEDRHEIARAVGTLHKGHFALEEDKTHFEGTHFSLNGENIGNVWKIEQLNVQDILLCGLLISENNLLHCKELKLKGTAFSATAEGDYTFDNRAFNGNIYVQTGSYEPHRISGVIIYDKGKFIGKKLHYKTTAEFCAPWVEPEGEMDLEFAPRTAVVKAGCKTDFGGLPFYVQLQLDHSEEVLGMLKISDYPQDAGIKCLFKSNFQIETIQGKIPGLEANLTKKSPETLWGSVKVDLSTFAKYLPEKQCKALKEMPEVEFEGSFDLKSTKFCGGLKAEKFNCFGFAFQELQGAITCSPEECLIENVTLEDPFCHILIKQFHMVHETEWKCRAPLVLVSDFQPSRFKGSVKPFTIKKLSLYDLSGTLGDLMSFTARGKLNFTNAYKKEFSILEIPLEVMKNLGLDFQLFTPVYGETEFELHEGKFILTEIMNTYSEGKRSEFYLPERSISYLDLEGNLNLDFKMKQNVLLNITEPFTLTVRGTIAKPKYSLVP